jgi:hypothetical protein
MNGLHNSEDFHVPMSAAERAAIREELGRMLAHPLFKNSRRCPILLRYVVERTLSSDSAELKERTLGVEVFGRDPNYDTNADPVVRATAGDIRKRIAQYYQEEDRDGEIRIELRPGSYLPKFRLPPATMASAPAAVAKAPTHRLKLAIGAGLVAALVLGSALTGLGSWKSRTELDRFWKPVLDSPNPVLMCVGQRLFIATRQESVSHPNPGLEWFDPSPVGDSPVPLFKLYYLGSQNVSYIDAVTMAEVAGFLQSRHKTVTYRRESATTFADMRNGPAVLIGAFDNAWTMWLTSAGRFQFHQAGRYFWIEDREHPSQRTYVVDYEVPYLNVAEDYALISRVRDPNTEQMVVVVAGLAGFGTQAAGEFLTEPAYMAAIAAAAPPHWDRKNMQLVLKTKVVRGNSGPPVVVAKYFW